MYVKIHESNGKFVLAVCDEELIGRTLRKGDICIKVSEKFYKGEVKNKDDVKELLKENDNINLIGKKSFKVLKEVMDIDESCVIYLEGGIPYVEVVVF